MELKTKKEERKKMYIAFMGPPLAVLNIVCGCGNTIRYGRDEGGWFVEGAKEIIIRPEDWYKEGERGESLWKKKSCAVQPVKQ